MKMALRNGIKLFGFTNNAAIAERKKVVKLGNLFSVKAPLFFFFSLILVILAKIPSITSSLTALAFLQASLVKSVKSC